MKKLYLRDYETKDFFQKFEIEINIPSYSKKCSNDFCFSVVFEYPICMILITLPFLNITLLCFLKTISSTKVSVFFYVYQKFGVLF